MIPRRANPEWVSHRPCHVRLKPGPRTTGISPLAGVRDLAHLVMIMIRCLLVVSFALAGLGHATITAGWKVPIERIAADYKTSDKVRKLDQPPGESAFFQPGDELWEISKAIHWIASLNGDGGDDPFAPDAGQQLDVPTNWQGDWIVWNARSEMVVARGSWNDILIAEHSMAWDSNLIALRTKVDLVTTGKGDTRSLSLISRSGEKARAKINGFEVELDFSIDRQSPIGDGRYHISWPSGTGSKRWSVNTAHTSVMGKRFCLAQGGQGEDSWKVFVTTSAELIDGTPLSQARLRETSAGLEPWKAPERCGNNLRKSLGPDLELGIYPASWELVSRLGSLEDLLDINAPESISDWVRGPLVDLRKLLKDYGVKFNEADHFAGFDPGSDRLFVLSDSLNQDLAEQILTPGCCRTVLNVWVETNPQSGGWGISTRSGEKAAITLGSGEASDTGFEIEPTVGGNQWLLDLRYKLDVLSGSRSIGSFQSNATIVHDQASVVGKYIGTDGEELEVTVRAKITDH